MKCMEKEEEAEAWDTSGEEEEEGEEGKGEEEDRSKDYRRTNMLKCVSIAHFETGLQICSVLFFFNSVKTLLRKMVDNCSWILTVGRQSGGGGQGGGRGAQICGRRRGHGGGGGAT